ECENLIRAAGCPVSRYQSVGQATQSAQSRYRGVLAEVDIAKRLQYISGVLAREQEILEIGANIQNQVQERLGKTQREHYLREQLRQIQKELSGSDPSSAELDDLRGRAEEAGLSKEAAAAVDRELGRLEQMMSSSPEYSVARTYVDWLLELPWKNSTEDHLDLKQASDILAADHFGLDKVKERILEYLAVRRLKKESKGPILCFVGPPGVGKTSLGRSIARAMGRKFARASLGGVRDEAEVRGHRRTYVGAMPGRIHQSLRRAGSRNPIFLLDEVDKLGADFRGDPSSALLEVLDPEQNHAFSDHYIEVPFDLSAVLFIATANTLATIPPALLDRMEVIELPGYTENDKRVIARRHLVPQQLDAHGLTAEQVGVTDAAIDRVVLEYTREAGVRNLDRQLAALMRKCASQVAAGETERIEVDETFVGKALGAPPHLPETTERTTQPGVAVGLAQTGAGGDILFIETRVLRGGKGIRLRITGQLGDVMQESAETALSWVRSNSGSLGLDEALAPAEIHLHVPAGAVAKDGPSAGVSIVTAMVSALSDRRARGSVAMTGEISLRGKVLPVGGIKGKLLAAARAGVQTVLLPRRNEKDLAEIPPEVLEKIDVLFVDRVQDVLDAALEPAPPASR
ncbi:MAG: endopeptidase La, partial [Myxococcota bacterium]|nr:endopeptidase La [Myxococcota bacterium]